MAGNAGSNRRGHARMRRLRTCTTLDAVRMPQTCNAAVVQGSVRTNAIQQRPVGMWPNQGFTYAAACSQYNLRLIKRFTSTKGNARLILTATHRCTQSFTLAAVHVPLLSYVMQLKHTNALPAAALLPLQNNTCC
jgi:hypothetical protein